MLGLLGIYTTGCLESEEKAHDIAIVYSKRMDPSVLKILLLRIKETLVRSAS